jgi:hypothetical protein
MQVPEIKKYGGEIGIRTFVTLCVWALRVDVCATCNKFCTYTFHPENGVNTRIRELSLSLFHLKANA